MSFEVDYDLDDGYFDDDWLYVEDDVPLADELAETSVPDPGYAGTNYEVVIATASYDPYEFWDDLEYGNNSYWDYDGSALQPKATSKTGSKRTRSGAREGSDASKRRKLGGTNGRHAHMDSATEYLPILFLSHSDRTRLDADRQRAAQRPLQSPSSFLADWRTRYARMDTLITKSMPPEMRQAAETREDDDEEAGEGEEEESLSEDDYEDDNNDDKHNERDEPNDSYDLEGVTDGDLLREYMNGHKKASAYTSIEDEPGGAAR